MKTTTRRSAFVALLLATGLLGACADANDPAVDQQGTTANTTCTETQGSNTRCS